MLHWRITVLLKRELGCPKDCPTNRAPYIPLFRGSQIVPPLIRGGQEGFKQAPIVFWDFQIDEKKKVAFRKEY